MRANCFLKAEENQKINVFQTKNYGFAVRVCARRQAHNEILLWNLNEIRDVREIWTLEFLLSWFPKMIWSLKTLMKYK